MTNTIFTLSYFLRSCLLGKFGISKNADDIHYDRIYSVDTCQTMGLTTQLHRCQSRQVTPSKTEGYRSKAISDVLALFH